MSQLQTQPPTLRDDIINASLELFYRDGIRATDVDQVIKKSGVLETVFYENFHSKDELVSAFLHKRHEVWMKWFTTAVEERYAANGGGLEVLADVLQIWFKDPKFRGCAFINTVAEGGKFDSEPFVIAREHKEDLKKFIRGIATKMNLRDPEEAAAAAVLVIEGAIVRVQMTGDAAEAHNARLLFQCLNHS
jgi:AcrR family transcriptional regulator